MLFDQKLHGEMFFAQIIWQLCPQLKIHRKRDKLKKVEVEKVIEKITYPRKRLRLKSPSKVFGRFGLCLTRLTPYLVKGVF